MATPFPRSLRALEADDYRITAITLGLAVLLVGGWCLWFIIAEIPLYATSEVVTLESSSTAVAEFSPEVVARLQRGQRVWLYLDAATTPEVAVVTAPGPRRRQVRLGLPRSLSRALARREDIIVGRAEVVVEHITPARWVLRAAGLAVAEGGGVVRRAHP
ncbi:MAG: hypothetical protein ACFCBW_14875 [Candidatus Competibacterales bacterium]